ncbi:MAG: methyl-accepting chemotaxis protein [Anaerolineae bacterium]|nr:methyl-accepting chemotaxis protein [Anaerolineae bacterium]
MVTMTEKMDAPGARQVSDSVNHIDIARVEEQIRDRRAAFGLGIMRRVIWGVGLFTLATLMTWLSFHQYTQLLGMAVLLLVLTVGVGAYPMFYRRGQSSLGMHLILWLLLLLCVGIEVLLPELILPAILGYVLVMLMSSLVLSLRLSLWFTVGSIVLSIVAVTWQQFFPFRWFAPLDSSLVYGFTLAFLIGIFLLISLMIRLNVTAQEAFIRRSKVEQREYLDSMVQSYIAYIEQVAHGNLSARLSLERDGKMEDDSLIVLGQGLNEMTMSLQQMILQIRDAANNLSSATAEILTATAQQAAGASEQSAAISETTTTVDELKTIAEQSSLRVQEVSKAAQRNVSVSQTGQQAVQATIESMEQIKDRVEGIAENILALSEQTQQIGEIIATVSEIAAQSNVLALNASVEAARAGEHGKGFAVVAVEVRNLAEQSRQATAQVKAILSEIQKATNATVMATEEGTKGVDHGVQLAAQADRSIDQLSSVISESAQAALQVVASGRQQLSGIEQIALAMQNIDQATVQSLVSTRQMERAAQNLNQLARRLTEVVSQYQL